MDSMSIVHCARYMGLIRQVIGVVRFIAVIVDGETEASSDHRPADRWTMIECKYNSLMCQR